MSTLFRKKYEIFFIRLFYVFFLSSLSAVLFGCGENMGDMYITQPQFRGKVTVIHGHPNGVPVRHSGNRQVFEIPTNGVLKSKGHPKDGFNSKTEFFRRIGGNKVEKLNLYHMHIDPRIPTPSLDLGKEVLFFADFKGEENVLLDGEADSVKAFAYWVKGWDFSVKNQ